MPTIFPFADYWFLYAGFSVLVALVLFGSIRAFHKKSHAISVREASISALSWFGLALVFNLFLFGLTYWRCSSDPALAAAFGKEPVDLATKIGLEFLSGYLVEKALAVDNLFVFIVIFRFFSIPPQFQYRVLFYGLFGAIVLRAIFIAMGSIVMGFQTVVILFGIFLVYQGVSVLRGKEPEIDPDRNRLIRTLNRFLPITKSLDGEHFFARINGKLFVTPLFLALIFVEFTDIMFAFDSVPAIFGLTKEPLVVFTSNIFAVIDLRALYFLLAAFISRFHYLNVGLSLVLIFIGSKMMFLDEYFGGHFPTEVSLLIVAGLIVGAIILSLVRPPKGEEKEASK